MVQISLKRVGQMKYVTMWIAREREGGGERESELSHFVTIDHNKIVHLEKDTGYEIFMNFCLTDDFD